MKRVFALALLCLAAASAAERPDPKKKARELLDTAVSSASAAQPVVQAPALRMAAECYQAFDKKRSLELFQQAFSVAGTLPDDRINNRARIQGDIAVATGALDLSAALGMLKQTTFGGGSYDPRVYTASRLANQFLAAQRFDAAIEMLDFFTDEKFYPHSAAVQVFRKLPEEDPRRMIVFGKANAANSRRPDQSFARFFTECREMLPQDAVEQGVRAVINGILDRKPDEMATTHAFASNKGTIALSDPKDAELFDLMWLVRQLDAKRYEEILSTRLALKSALEQFPQGTKSMAGEGPMWSFITSGDANAVKQAEARQRMEAFITSRVVAVQALLRKDPDKALEAITNVPDASRQAELLASVARTVAANDRERAKTVIARCIEAAKKLKDGETRITVWDGIADAAYQSGDSETMDMALEAGLTDAASLLKSESNVHEDNVVPRERWPSTIGFRRLSYRAAVIRGVDAELLLARVSDPDLQLMMRIEMAQALLGRAQELPRSQRPRLKN